MFTYVSVAYIFKQFDLKIQMELKRSSVQALPFFSQPVLNHVMRLHNHLGDTLYL